MKKFAKKFLVLSMATGLVATSLVGCSQEQKPQTDDKQTTTTGDSAEAPQESKPESKYTTVVVSSEDINGVFNPLFAMTGPDNDVNERIFESLVKSDRLAQPQEALAEFKIDEIQGENGEVAQSIYTFTLKEGVKHSDGSAVTADDIIFTYMVYADPTYDGAATLYGLPIVGMKEYREGDATDIPGIVKIDERTVQVTLDGVDPAAIWKLGGIAPVSKAYYGEGFTKGDLSAPKSKNSTPMGSGAYTFESFDKGVVTLKANANYYKGQPLTPTIKIQYIAQANKLEVVKLGECDIADPAASPAMVTDVEAANLEYRLIDNLGYGYIGMNAKRIPDINVRKGLMHLMNRRPAIETYYGDLATVIERPMSSVSWAYPEGATEYYGFDPAKALEYFTAAGYTQVDKGGKPSLEKEGKQLVVEVGISGQGTMDHPSAPILTQMKTEMEKIGAVLEIMDTDGAVFLDKLNAAEWDMWVAAWQATPDPDMYQLYHSKGATNRYQVFNDELDKEIEAARGTNDITVRKEHYSKALDIVMEEAVEMPVYQRKNMYVFNPEIVDMDSLPVDMTPYYKYFAEVETFSLK